MCAGNSIHFRHTNGCSWESVKVFETENVSTWEGLEPPTFGFMPNALTYWAIRAKHLMSHATEYWLWRYRYYFKVKLTFEMLIVREQQHSFSTHEWVFLGKCQRFWDRKCLDLRGARIQTFGFMPNALTCWAIRARQLLSNIFEYWLWRYKYFLSEVNIWNINCARATTFIFDTRTGVLGKVSKFLR